MELTERCEVCICLEEVVYFSYKKHACMLVE